MSVAVWKWSGPRSLDDALEAVDAWQAFRPGMSVLIKPNAVMGGSPKIFVQGFHNITDGRQGTYQDIERKRAGEAGYCRRLR